MLLGKLPAQKSFARLSGLQLRSIGEVRGTTFTAVAAITTHYAVKRGGTVLLILGNGAANQVLNTITDDFGLTWNIETAIVGGGSVRRIYYAWADCPNGLPRGTIVTSTFAGTVTFGGVLIGSDKPFDIEVHKAGSSGTGTTQNYASDVAVAKEVWAIFAIYNSQSGLFQAAENMSGGQFPGMFVSGNGSTGDSNFNMRIRLIKLRQDQSFSYTSSYGSSCSWISGCDMIKERGT